MRWFCTILISLLLPCTVCGEEVFYPLKSSRQIYDRYGTLVRQVAGDKYAQYVPLAEISPWLVAAAVAAEDKNFFSHNGVDMRAVLRASWQNATEGKVVSGASTITQQLARAIEPRPKNLWGKTREAYKAAALEKDLSKEEILEAYFNVVELGNLTQGVEAASQFYFQVPASDVSVSQAAFLVGLIKSPTYYNPLKHFKRALTRRDYVLKKMLENGFISDEIYKLARTEQIVLKKSPRPFEAPHFTQFLERLLPLQGTTKVRTTLDRDAQLFAQEVVKNNVAKLGDFHVTNGAAVIVENKTGAVVAYVGSADFHNSQNSGQVDGARALRQPGSALKPFVYGLAFEKKVLTPASLIQDEDTFFDGGFRPRNYDETFHGAVSVRKSLACSYNVPAVRALEMSGVNNLLALLHAAGVGSLQKPDDFYGLGLALGNGEVRLLELTNAYASLARGGIYQPLQVAFSPAVYYPEQGKNKRVLSAQSAFLVTDILRDNQARAPSFGLNSALYVPFEMAAKTGTSKDYKDNFAFGYTPRWTIGVWVGNFDATPMQKVSGITGAGPILHDLAVYMQEKYPSAPFKEPEQIVRKAVCTQSGLLAGKNCKHTREEVFDAQFLPDTCDGKHQASAEKVRISFPQAGDIFKIDPAVKLSSQKIKFTARCAQAVCAWKLDNQALKDTSCDVWWPLQAGKYTLSVTCGADNAQTHFEVLE